MTELINACGIGDQYPILNEITLYSFPDICLSNSIPFDLPTCCAIAARTTDDPEGTLRLTGTGSSEYGGRIEISNGEYYKTICNQGTTNTLSTLSNVLCRQLGHKTDGAIVYNVDNSITDGWLPYGEGLAYIGCQSFQCSGSETNLYQYSKLDWDASSGCIHQEDIAIECPSPETGAIRLVGSSSTEYSGIPQVLGDDGEWRTICNNNILDSYNPIGSVICNGLGLYPQRYTLHNTDLKWGFKTCGICGGQIQDGTPVYIDIFWVKLIHDVPFFQILDQQIGYVILMILIIFKDVLIHLNQHMLCNLVIQIMTCFVLKN